MDLRIRLLILAAFALLVAAVWTFPTWYPLLNRDSVSVAFPGLPLELQAEYMLLPEPVRQAYEKLRDGNRRDNIPARPDVALALLLARLTQDDIVAPDQDILTTIPPEARILRRGTFITPDPTRGATGNITIYQLPTLVRYVRLDDFQSVRAPDLHLILTRNPDPYDAAGVGVDYIDIGKLLGNVGTQTYIVPRDVDFGVYPILAIYSPTLDFVISTATLR